MTENKKIRLAKSVLSSAEADNVQRVMLEDGYLGMGTEVKRFEERLAEMLQRQVVTVNSGTAALHLAIEALITPGDEVLVPTITYVATYQAIIAAGGVPVSCDVHQDDMNIDLVDAESKITAKTTLILPVLYAGNGASIGKVQTFSKKHNLRTVFDAAHCFGSTYQGKLVGAIGDVFCFSFDGIKNITCGEGGAVTSDDKNVIEYVKNARLLGVRNDTEQRFQGRRSWQFDVTHKGYRYHLSNIFAAIGNVQLDRLAYFSERRKELCNLYQNNLQNMPHFELINLDLENTIPHIYPVKLAQGIPRDKLRKSLLEEGIETGVHYFPNHLLTMFHSKSSDCPVAERIYPGLLSLPLHPEILTSQVNNIVSHIERFILDQNL